MWAVSAYSMSYLDANEFAQCALSDCLLLCRSSLNAVSQTVGSSVKLHTFVAPRDA